jgi:hypothetical protein
MQGYIKPILLVFVGKTGPFYGWQKNLEIYQQVYPDKAAITLIFDIKQKMIDKKTCLCFRCLEFANGKRGTKKIFTLLVKKFKEGWKIVVDHSS